jgi:hypothetical protein
VAAEVFSSFTQGPFGSGFDFGFGGAAGGQGGPGGPDGKGFQNFWEEVQDFFSEGNNQGKRGSSNADKKIRKGKDVTVFIV